jgi:ribosomal protein S18 acetylase RimI-like enzyme
VTQNVAPDRRALRLRTLTAADLPFADSIRALAGWNQTVADWERFLATEPDGCFLAECGGTPAGTATTTVYSADLGWIGMVIVHPDFRRRGAGTALLKHCIDYLRNRGVVCLKLDATPAGKMVYDGLGFRHEWTLKRWEGCPAGPEVALTGGLRAWQASDEAHLEPLDTAAFGVCRRKLLVTLANQSSSALVVQSTPNSIDGLGFARAGSRAVYLGPVIAHSPETGLRLLLALVSRYRGQKIFWDIPDSNQIAVALAQHHGFTEQRRLIRMFLGENALPGDPRMQYALAGPEVG